MLATRSVPVLSGSAAESGVDGFVLKPFTPPVLKDRIDQVLSSVRGAAA